MPVGEEDHGRVAVTVPVAQGGLDQRIDLTRGEMLLGT
jgi:hypothetical protein